MKRLWDKIKAWWEAFWDDIYTMIEESELD